MRGKYRQKNVKIGLKSNIFEPFSYFTFVAKMLQYKYSRY